MKAPCIVRTCRSCRHWRRVSSRAVIGHCVRDSLDASYSNESQSCAEHRMEATFRVALLLAEQRALVAKTRKLLSDARTRVEIARQLVSDAQALRADTRVELEIQRRIAKARWSRRS